MSNKIAAINFSAAVRQILDEYGASAQNALMDNVGDVAKDAAKRVRSASRGAFGAGKYSSGWKSQITTGRLRVEAVVYGGNPTSSLAHLLEHGHVTRNGTGRTFPDTPGREHIAPVNDWAQDELIRRTVEDLEALT